MGETVVHIHLHGCLVIGGNGSLDDVLVHSMFGLMERVAAGIVQPPELESGESPAPVRIVSETSRPDQNLCLR